ncbi:MAG: orotate phosphoribosyltransferase, partial [Nannocystaceae bacterium]
MPGAPARVSWELGGPRGMFSAMQAYEREFVDLLVRYQAIRFGDFTLKSGRRSPYFVNAGQLRSGAAIAGIGQAYAAAIERAALPCDLVFGPAYKGISLAISTAMALSRGQGDVPFGFDRKEEKDHGEGGWFVGTTPGDGMRVVIVDDVVTSGQSIRAAIALLKRAADIEVSGVVVAVDRQERGRTGNKSTLHELQEELGVDIHPIVTVRELVDDLRERRVDGVDALDDARYREIDAYLRTHACGCDAKPLVGQSAHTTPALFAQTHVPPRETRKAPSQSPSSAT